MMKGKNYNLTTHKMRPMCARMNGLTLVEMLIAVVLSLGLVGGIITLYVNVGESASYLNAASRIQENGRFALDHIVRTMRMAGYDDPAKTNTTRPTLILQGKSGSVITMSGFTVKSSSDAVQISHEGAALVRDCRGVAVAEDTWVTNTYAISSANELICNTVTNAAGVLTTGTGQVIAEGVEGLNIRWGVDTDADGVANRYYTAASVTDWTTVVSAKIALLVNSVGEVYGSTLHDCESCEIFNPTANNLMRAEFQATINFRNSLGA
jgi:type IV pilus assembly protein PilW